MFLYNTLEWYKTGDHINININENVEYFIDYL